MSDDHNSNWFRKLLKWPAMTDSDTPLASYPSRPTLGQRTAETPKTLSAEMKSSSGQRPVVFDPSLRHLVAHRAGEPRFSSKEVERLWHNARSLAIHYILSRISSSDFADFLVLRGSVLLRTWLGDKARRPGDLDWVVQPDSWQIHQQRSRQLIEGAVSLLRGARWDETFSIPNHPFACEEIWLYEKAPGVRVIVPWKCDEPELSGTIQMDFVFGEKLPSPPIKTDVVIDEHPPITLQAATAAQSLAWKLLWLTTDMDALGKDLYDATLLAEYVALDADLLVRTFELSEEGDGALRWFSRDHVDQEWITQWDEFRQEYPGIHGTEQEWKSRLIQSLDSLFTELEQR